MARSLNGSTDQIDAGTSGTLQPTSACTCSIWINPGTLSNAYNQLIGWDFCHIFLKSNSKLALYVNVGGNTFNYDGTGTNTLSSNTWYHIAWTAASGVAAITGYVNGVSDGSVNGNSGALVQSGNFTMGWDHGTAGRNFPGKLADGAVWSTVLSASEIAALAAGIRPKDIRSSSLVGYWCLDGINSPEPDLSGNAKNGTLTGTALAAGPPVGMFTPHWPSNLPPPASSFIPAWAARGSNLPVLGTGTF